MKSIKPRRTPPEKTKNPKKASRSAPQGAETAKPTPGSNPRRVRAILGKLDEAYSNVNCALQHQNAFQLLIATILSAQCTDERVNTVTPKLFKMFPTPEALAYAHPGEIENI